MKCPSKCPICQQEFKTKGALTFHTRIRHEGRSYPQLWPKGHIPWSKGLKGIHCSPSTEWKKGDTAGAKHPNWKEGRVKSGGYIMVTAPGHHRVGHHGNYVYEHIIVWEQAHHQLLPDGYVVHHLNGIKHDNRSTNLLAVPLKGHSPSLTVKEVQKRLREVEAQLTQRRLSDSFGEKGGGEK